MTGVGGIQWSPLGSLTVACPVHQCVAQVSKAQDAGTITTQRIHMLARHWTNLLSRRHWRVQVWDTTHKEYTVPYKDKRQ